MDVNPLRPVKKKLGEWRRVLKITRKPDREEFTMSAKVTGAGILLLGAIGFTIYFGATMLTIVLRGGS
ncbi:MAG: protein translocase SEC61 complex subunit gamma [Candidatus Nanohaloarchaea archaeon]|nr:protein translocase SEC61 complex subunit gamma [Candidatus Nanohaloarchaea archaeon]